MNQLKRRIYRFRAKVYARLPKNRSLLKVGILCMLALGMVLYYKIRTVLPEFFSREEEAVHASSGNTVDYDKEKGTDKVSENGYKVPEDGSKVPEDGSKVPEDGYKVPENGSKVPEDGYLDVQYVESDIRPPVITPDAAPTNTPTELADATGMEEQSAKEEQPAVETGTKPAVSLTGLVPAVYPKLSDIVGKRYLLSNLKQLGYLKDTFYIVNQTTKMTESNFNAERFLKTDLSIEKKEGVPQILIYHTHASEAFVDSRKGVEEDTVVGMGDLLAAYLTEKYGYTVLHDKTVFDMKNGVDNRSHAYNEALTYMEQLLKENPSIEVIIDLHRDAGAKRVATIQGKQVAKVMLFNGLSRNTSGELSYLPNKNLPYNLAFSFQMKLIGDEMYPGLMNKIFLKDYRYNMHLAERYLLIELGTSNNTVEEAANAMEPLADVLAQVLGGV